MVESPPQPRPRSCSRSSSMPKWWATSCTTVIRTSSRAPRRVAHVEQRARGRCRIRSGSAGVVGGPLGQRDPVVEAEQVGVVRRGRRPRRAPRRCRPARRSRRGSRRGPGPTSSSNSSGSSSTGMRPSYVAASANRAGSDRMTTESRARSCAPAGLVATPTGLEPAASAVTGRRANQLRYGARWPDCCCRSGWNSNPSSSLAPNRGEPVLRPAIAPPTGFEPALPP